MTNYFPVGYVFVIVVLKVTLSFQMNSERQSVLFQEQISYTYAPTCNYSTYRTLGECSHRRLYKVG